jgi:hypothetical protein
MMGGFMNKQPLLMVFEELWPILLKTSFLAPIWRQIRIPAGYFSVLQGKPDPDVLAEWVEKNRKTWWEVTWETPNSAAEPVLQQCWYIADTFADAVRLRPDLTISYGSLETLTAPEMELFEDLEPNSFRLVVFPAAKTAARA